MMQPAEEILNIDHNIKILCLRALNKYPTKIEAAKELGMTVRNLYRLVRRYNIVRETEFGGRYVVAERELKLKIA